jgi:hypothetical protein
LWHTEKQALRLKRLMKMDLSQAQRVSETFSANTFFELGRQAAGPLWFTGFVGA